MGIASSGSISIKTAAGTDRSIDAENTAVSSGSLVALSTSAIEGLSTLNESPYAMSEFYDYTHIQDMSMTETFVGRVASTHWMTRINESDSGTATFITTGPEFKFEQIKTFVGTNIYTMKMYVRRDVGGTNNVNYSTYYPQSGSASLLSTSSWTLFNTVVTAMSGGWDNIGLDTLSHDSSTSGSGYLSDIFNENVGESATYNVHPAGTYVAGYDGTRTWYYACRLFSNAECGSASVDRTTTFKFRFKKSGYNDYTTPAWTHAFDHDHLYGGCS